MLKEKREFVLGLAFALVAGLSLGALGDWTTGYNALPAGTQPVSDLDDSDRSIKEMVQERAKKELDWGTSAFETGYGDTGRANPGSARAFYQSALPTSLRRPDNSGNQTGGILGQKDIGRLFVDSDDLGLWVYGCTSGDPEPITDCTSRSFRRVWAGGSDIPIVVVGESTLDTQINSAGSFTAITSWSGGGNSTTVPSDGSWYGSITAVVLVRNDAGSDRDVRVDLYDTTVSTILHSVLVSLKPGEAQTVTLNYVNSFGGGTRTFVIRAEASGPNVFYNGGTHTLTGNGPASHTHHLVRHFWRRN